MNRNDGECQVTLCDLAHSHLQRRGQRESRSFAQGGPNWRIRELNALPWSSVCASTRTHGKVGGTECGFCFLAEDYFL